MRRAQLILLLGLLAPALASAEDPKPPLGAPPAAPPAPASAAKPPAPLTVEQSADSVLAAVRAKDSAALKALGAKDDPDPWLVADELLARIEPDAALGFAKAAPRVATQKLGAYVGGQTGRAYDSAARAAIDRANKAFDASDPRSALDILLPISLEKIDTVCLVRVAYARGLALDRLDRQAEASPEFLRAAGGAERLGWLVRQAAAVYRAAADEDLADQLEAASGHYRQALALEQTLSNSWSVARSWSGLGNVQRRLHDFDHALESQKMALALFEGLKHRAGIVVALGRIGQVYEDRLDWKGAIEAYERALAAEMPGLGNDMRPTYLRWIADLRSKTGAYDAALEALERAHAIDEEIKDFRDAARDIGAMGNVHLDRQDYPAARDAFRQALERFEKLGDRKGIARMLDNLGIVHDDLGEYAEATSLFTRALAIHEEEGDKDGVASSLGGLANVYGSLGDYAKARNHHERALAIHEELRDREGMAGNYMNLAIVEMALAEYGQALKWAEKSLAIQEGRKDRAAIADVLASLGAIHRYLGNFGKSIEFGTQALRMHEQMGRKQSTAIALMNLGVVHVDLGNYAKALDLLERAEAIQDSTKDRVGMAKTLGNLSLVHLQLGDFERAVEFQKRALHLREELGDPSLVAASLGDVGMILMRQGKYDAALEFHRKAYDAKKRLGDRGGMALNLANIAGTRMLLKLADGVAEALLEARELFEAVGNHAGVALTLVNLAIVSEGDDAKAMEYASLALALSQELGLRETTVRSLFLLAHIHVAAKRHSEAVEAARRAVDEMAGLVQGASEEQGALARAFLSDMFPIGPTAAAGLNDPAAFLFFVESFRAGALLESLKVRSALTAWALPAPLAEAERSARLDETAASAALRSARASGALDAVARARTDLDRARTEVKSVIQRIQREAMAYASVAYPKADSLDAIRGRLREDEALIVYELLSEQAMALVVTAREARIVTLGSQEDVKAACLDVDASDRKRDPSQSAAKLRRLVVDPLGLDTRIARVFVSPNGPLSYVPLSLLFSGVETAYEPSGTTLGLLLGESGKRGTAVLAVGDPEVDPLAQNPWAAVLADDRGESLGRLPSAREEARAVGDDLLIDKEATEARLRQTLLTRPRWHAVHFACHGLLDAEQPSRSSLALAPGGEDDGYLTASDIFRLKMPTDLVVLSACRTGQGRIAKGEGIVGLARAFMFAGAPRVLVSLWKVDDDATRALMVKFYALWNPKDGSKPMGTAAALKAAQEFVRSQEKWKHPYYWAAWVLWGLPS